MSSSIAFRKEERRLRIRIVLSCFKHLSGPVMAIADAGGHKIGIAKQPFGNKAGPRDKR